MAYAPVNGFDAVDYGSPKLAVYEVPGSDVRLSLRKETAPLQLAALRDWNKEVEPLRPGACWGHAYRPVRGAAASTSFHAPGIATDQDSDRHPLGSNPASNFTPAQIAAIHKILARYTYKGVRLFRWGGDYTGRKDGMHLEIIAQRALVLEAVRALQTPPPKKPAPVTPKFTLPAGHWYGVQDGKTPGAHAGTNPADTDEIKAIQAALNHLGNHLVVDGKFGPATEEIVTRFQSNRKLTADGKVGPVTWGRMFS